MNPLGASVDWSALWPQLLTPRPSAVCTTIFGLSTWQAMTSQPASISALVALGLAHRHRPVAGDDEMDARRRIDLLHPEREGVDVAEHQRDRLGGDEADLVGLGGEAGGDAVHVVALVEVAEIAAEIRGMLGLVPEGCRVAELDLGIFPGRIDHERVEIAERGREQELGAVDIDHRLHGLGDGVGFGDVLLLQHRDIRMAFSALAPTAWAWFQPKSSRGPT